MIYKLFLKRRVLVFGLAGSLILILGVFLFSQAMRGEAIKFFEKTKIFKAALVLPQEPSSIPSVSTVSIAQEVTEIVVEAGKGLSFADVVSFQDQMDDVSEQLDEINQEVVIIEAGLNKLKGGSEDFGKVEKTEIKEMNDIKEPTPSPTPLVTTTPTPSPLPITPTPKPKSNPSGGSGIVFCDRRAGDEGLKDKMIFNEIAWMGTASSSNDEWIELKNLTQDWADISGWQIQDKDRQIKISFENGKRIGPSNFFILERTNDSTLPGIPADLIYTGGLNDSNEYLYLFDNHCQLQDDVLADPNWPAGSKEERRTMERGGDFLWHTYNGIGSNGIMGTPKAENSQPVPTSIPTPTPTPFLDTEPPQVVFSLKPIQNSLSFSIYLTLIDSVTSGIDAVTPSIIDAVTPSGLDGFVFRWKDGENDWQEDPYYSIGGSPTEISLEKQFSGEDEHSYYFQIRAKDKAGNISAWLPDPPASTTISLPKNILINEIQIDGSAGLGGADDDWIELYNPYNYEISLSGWSLQEHSQSDTCSIDVSFYKKNFSLNAKIPAKGFYLAVDTQANAGLKAIADLTIGWSLTEGNTIYLVKNQDKIESGADLDIIDKVGLQGSCFPEGAPAQNPEGGKSLQRKELGIDTNDNSQDFEITDTPSPTNSKGIYI